jgi:glyoxylase-like metal-dependent hydrolase (beta-lactamase superfamily II)
MSSLKTIIVQVTPFVQNASIVYCVETKKCAFIDPGGDIEILLEKAKESESYT